MKEIREIMPTFERHRGEPLALATLVRARGSSYRRPGARMLITARRPHRRRFERRLPGRRSGGSRPGSFRHWPAAPAQFRHPAALRLQRRDRDAGREGWIPLCSSNWPPRKRSRRECLVATDFRKQRFVRQPSPPAPGRSAAGRFPANDSAAAPPPPDRRRPGQRGPARPGRGPRLGNARDRRSCRLCLTNSTNGRPRSSRRTTTAAITPRSKNCSRSACATSPCSVRVSGATSSSTPCSRPASKCARNSFRPPASISARNRPSKSRSPSSRKSRPSSREASAESLREWKRPIHPPAAVCRRAGVKIGAVVLAAGSSSRLGQPKQLLIYRGTTLVRRSAQAALDAGCAPVVVVLGVERERITAELAASRSKLSGTRMGTRDRQLAPRRREGRGRLRRARHSGLRSAAHQRRGRPEFDRDSRKNEVPDCGLGLCGDAAACPPSSRALSCPALLSLGDEQGAKPSSRRRAPGKSRWSISRRVR